MTENDENSLIPDPAHPASRFDVWRALPICSLIALGITLLLGVSVQVVPALLQDGLHGSSQLLKHWLLLTLVFFPVNLATALLHARTLTVASKGASVTLPSPPVSFLFSIAAGFIYFVIYEFIYRRSGQEDWAGFFGSIYLIVLGSINAAVWLPGGKKLTKMLCDTSG